MAREDLEFEAGAVGSNVRDDSREGTLQDGTDIVGFAAPSPKHTGSPPRGSSAPGMGSFTMESASLTPEDQLLMKEDAGARRRPGRKRRSIGSPRWTDHIPVVPDADEGAESQGSKPEEAMQGDSVEILLDDTNPRDQRRGRQRSQGRFGRARRNDAAALTAPNLS